MRENVWKRRLAVLLALALIWNVLADHLVSVQAAVEGMSGAQVMSAESLEGDQDGFSVYSFAVNTIEDGAAVPITDASEVAAGETVKVTFEWKLDNSVRLQDGESMPQIFTIDTKSAEFQCSGIDIAGLQAGSESAHLNLYATGQGNPVGTYYMEDGVIYIVITDETFFQNEDNRYGGVSFTGTIADSDDVTEDGSPKEIAFGTESVTPTYYVSGTESSAQVNKSTSGSLQKVGDKYYQTFTLTVKANHGTVTNINLTDTVSPAGMMSNPSDVQVTASTVDGVAVQNYASLDEALAAIAAATFYMDQTVILQYTMEVDPSIYASNAEYFKNSISGTYDSNRSDEPKNVSTEAGIYVNKPSVNKTAQDYQVRDGKGYVTWTITINLGDYYTGNSTDLADYLSSVKELPGAGLTQSGETIDLNPSDFVQDSNNPAVFTYTYETQVEQSLVDSASDENVKNKVSFTTVDGNTYESYEAGYTISGAGPYVKKTIHDMYRDEDGLHVTWDIEISGIPKSGITELSLHEDARHYNNTPGSQSLLYEIYIDGVLVADANGIIDNDKIAEIRNWSSGSYGTIVFQDAYVDEVAEAEGTIRVQVKTLVTEDTIGKEYGNGAKASYKSTTTGSETTMPESRATFQDTTNILFKESAVVAGKDAIDYTIKVILPPLNIQEFGRHFVIDDILPVGMKMSSEGAQITLTDQWGNKRADIDSTMTSSEVTVEGSTEKATKVSFDIECTENWVSLIKGYEGGSGDGYYLVIKYRAELKDRAAFLKAGETESFTNSASGTYDGNTIGADSVTNELTPTQIVNKSAEYTESTAPFIKYTVEVNTEAVTLLDGSAKLQAVDTIGSALKFVDSDYFTDEANKNFYRIQVIDVEAGVELTKDTDYTYTLDASRHVLSMELPDGKHLRLIYWAYAAPKTNLTAENSTNSFKLSGMVSDALSDECSFTLVAYTPEGWAGSEVGSIVLYKFWTDEGEQIALNGSVFKLIKVKYDAQTNSLVPDGENGDEVIYEEIRITEENRVGENGSGKLIIENLPVNQIMALYEIDADEGFALNKKPYYFVIEGSTAVTLPSGFLISEFVSGETLSYENKKAGTLILEKTVEGDVSQDDIEGVITFTVKDAEGTLVGTYKPGDTGFTYADGKWKLTLNDLMPGEYTVEETVYDATGHEVVKVVYSINQGAWSSDAADAMDTETDVTIVAEETTTITFKNVYEEFTVPVSKVALTGGQAIEGAILRITGTKADGTAITPIEWTTTAEAKEVKLYAGTYVLTEVTAPVGYKKAAPISFTVAADGTVTVGSDAVTTVVMKDEAISVKFNKVDADDNSVKLPGATIALYAASDIGGNGSPVQNAQPLATWISEAGEPYDFGPYVECGKDYVLVEAGAPNGYEVASNIAFTVNEDGTFTVTETGVDVVDGVILMEDAKIAGSFGSILLTKSVLGVLDKDELVGNIQFKVEKIAPADPAYSETFTLGQGNFQWNEEQGKYVLSLTNLAVGTYKVTEILGTSTPGDMICTVTYQINSVDGTGTETGNVTVAENAETVVAFTNTYANKMGKLKVAKTFAVVGQELTWAEIAPNLSFEIYDENDEEVTGSPIAGTDLQLVGGVYVSEELDLPVGTYTVKENYTTITNYKLTTAYTVTVDDVAGGSGDSNLTGDVSVEEGVTTTVTFANTYSYASTYPVPVSKVILGSSTKLAGARFTITGTKASGGSIATIAWTSDENVYEARLYPGNYTLTETEAPVGYAKADPIEFTVENDGTITVNSSAVTSLEMEDAPLEFKVVKTAADGSTRIAGAEFELYKASDVTDGVPNQGAVMVDSWTSAVTGHKDFGSKLICGEQYVLIETYAPKGYCYMDPVTFTVGDDGAITVNLGKDGDVYLAQNTPFSVKLKKVNEEDTSEELSGAVIKVYREEDVNVDGTVNDGASAIVSWTSVAGETFDFGEYLEAGKSYVFVETVAPAGYEITTNISFAVKKDGTVEITSSGTEEMSGGVILMKDKAQTVAPETGSLKLTKTVSGVMDKADLEGVLKFTVENADQNTPAYNETFILGEDDFTWDATAGKYVLVIEDLPVGTYKVTEVLGTSTPDNMICTTTYMLDNSQPAAGTSADAVEVTKDTESTVEFENAYDYITGVLRIQKTFVEDTDTLTWDDIKDKIKFKIYDETGAEISESNISAATFQKQGDSYVFDIVLPIGTYKVEEIVTTVTGYTVTATYSVNAGASTVGGATGDLVLSDGQTVTVAYVNTYAKQVTAPGTGSLIITKQLKGTVDRTLAENAITFTVTNKDTGVSEVYKLSEFDYDATTSTYTLELDYTEGGYTVEETVTDVEGYRLTKVTYTIGGSTSTGKKAEITLIEDDTVTVAYTDTYKKIQAPSDDDDDDDDDDEEEEIPTAPSPKEVSPAVVTTSLTKTGDDTPLRLWLVMFGLGMIGMVAGGIELIRRSRRS